MSKNITWQAPIAFDGVTTPEITADVSSDALRDFIKATALAAEVPEALPLMVTLGVISACAAKRYTISPKEGWLEPINIYSVVALPPANNKSLIMNQCLAPIVEWEKQTIETTKHERNRQISMRKSQEKLIDGKRSTLARTQKSEEQQLLFEEIAMLESKLQEISPLPQLFANDATPESLGQLLAEQKGKLAIFSDEAGILETLSGLYSGGSANVDILLKGIDGGHIRMRRKDREYSLNPYLTLMLAIQPERLYSIAEKRAFSGNGMLERFLYVVPQSKLGFRTHNTPPVPHYIRDCYHALISRLLNEMSEGDETIILKLHPQAYEIWKVFRAETEKELRPSGKLYPCLGWGGKICGFTLRLAALLHIASETKTTDISPSIMNNAVKLASLLKEHALFTFGMMGANNCVQDAKELWQWMEGQNAPSLKRSEISHALRQRKLGNKERLTDALHLLSEMHYITSETLPTRKPTTIYHLNPLAIKGGENV